MEKSVFRKIINSKSLKTRKKREYQNARNWERAIRRIKLEKPIVDPQYGVIWGTTKDKVQKVLS